MKHFKASLLVLFTLLTAFVSSGVFAQNCTTLRGAQVLDGKSTTGYSTPTETYTTSCTGARSTLYCNKGSFGSIGNVYKYQTCTPQVWKNCTTPVSAKHLEYETLYSASVADYSNTCSSLGQSFQCINGAFTGSDVSKYTASSCTEKARKPCINIRTNSYVNHLDTIFGYSVAKSTETKSCEEFKQTLTCTDASWTPRQSQLFESCQDLNIKSCSFTGGDNILISIPHGTSKLLYSTSFSNYPETCEKSSGIVSCNNGELYNSGYYKFPKCINGVNSKPLTIGTDLDLTAKFPNGETGISQYSNPTLNVFMTNKGTNGISGTNVPAGFLTCVWADQGLIIYQSKVITQLTINPGTTLKKTIGLNNLFTQGLGDKNIVCTLRNRPGEAVTTNNTTSLKLSVTDAGRFDLALNKAIDPIKGNLDAPEIRSGVAGVNDFLMNKVMNILVPLIILVAILTAMFGFYKLFFATDDKAISTGVKLIGFGVVGIIVIMSANFFATTLYKDIFLSGDLGYGSLQGYSIAQKLYEQLLFPFIKIAIYLSLGVLFVMLAARVITFVFGSDDDTKKKAGTIITWNIIGMLVIIGAKQLVEFVYGKQADVVKSVSNLGEIGSGLLATKNFPFLYQVINWAMGLASLLILVMVLFQAFQLLMKPDAPDAMKKIKNSLLYIFIGIVIIGTGYIITNFLIIN